MFEVQKKCKECKTYKDFSEFYKRKSGPMVSLCKLCNTTVCMRNRYKKLTDAHLLSLIRENKKQTIELNRVLRSRGNKKQKEKKNDRIKEF